jgi:hypothetical protein
MFIHIYRKDSELAQETQRVTLFTDRKRNAERYGHDDAVLILGSTGTAEGITVIPMSEVDWYWIEEN